MRPPRHAPLALVACALAGRAAAQNSDGVLLGAEAAATGGAVLATARDPAGAFYNPAGLARLEGPTLQVSGSVYEVSSLRLSRYVVTTLPWTRTEETVTPTSLFPVAAVAAYGLRLREGLGVAAGAWVPVHDELAVTSDLRTSGPFAAGGSVTQAEYEQHLSLSQTLERTYFGAAAGLALGPRVRAGLAAFVTYDSAEAFATVFAAVRTDSPVPAESGGTASVSLSGAPYQVAVRLGAGVQWDVTQALTVAASVRTSSLELFRGGSVSTVVSGVVLLPGLPPTVQFAFDRTAAPRLSEPWRLAAGGALAAGAWSLRAEGDWQVPTSETRGVANARIGVLHDAGGDARWGAGVFTDRSLSPGGAGSFRVDYYGVAAGLAYRPGPVRAARDRGGSWDVWTSFAVRYAFGSGEVQGVSLDPLGTGAPPRPPGDVRAHALALSVGGVVQF